MNDLDVGALDAIARQSESAVVNCTLPSSELRRQLEMRGIPFVIFSIGQLTGNITQTQLQLGETLASAPSSPSKALKLVSPPWKSR
jgi:hypothetical protein